MSIGKCTLKAEVNIRWSIIFPQDHVHDGRHLWIQGKACQASSQRQAAVVDIYTINKFLQSPYECI